MRGEAVKLLSCQAEKLLSKKPIFSSLKSVGKKKKPLDFLAKDLLTKIFQFLQNENCPQFEHFHQSQIHELHFHLHFLHTRHV